ncbi:MAG: AEC family transporter [Betaproteobacteria bacterium]
MTVILLQTFPFFALVLCGFMAARLRFLPVSAITGLNAFVLYFALPCMLYRFGADTPLSQLLDVKLALLYLLCALFVVLLAVLIARRRHLSWNDSAFGALVATFPNTGFMGVPLLVSFMGVQAAGPAIVTILVDLVLISSLCIALSRLDGAGLHGAEQAAAQALKGVLSNPMPWAVLLGALASGLELQPVAPVMKTITLLADAASPVALFTIGAVLARSQMASAGRAVLPSGEEAAVVLIKLVVHPALVAGLGALAMASGLGLSVFSVTTATLVAALPSASNVSLLSERFGANTARIARIILWSTVLAFLTFSVAVSWLL